MLSSEPVLFAAGKELAFATKYCLSVYSENPPITKEVLTSLTSLPEEVAIENLLLTTRAKQRDFLAFPVKPRHASRLAQPNFGNLSKITIASMREIG